MKKDPEIEKIKNLEAIVASLTEQLAVQEKIVAEQSERIRQNEEALRKDNERYRSLVETTSDWVWEVDENGVYTYTNPRVFDLIGYSPEDVLGKTPFDFMLPEEAASVGEEFGQIVESQKPFHSLENATRHKDGHIVILETSGVPVFDPNGEFVGYRGIDRDITTRKLAEEALRESMERYQSLVETTSDWVWEVDENGVYTYTNPRVFDLIGYSPEEVLGKTPFDFMLPEDAATVGEEFGQIVESQKPFHSLENAARHKEGHIVVLETSGVPVFDQNGDFLGYRGIDRDITERKQAEDALRESNERFIIFIKEAAMRLKNPMEVVEENISLVIGEIENNRFNSQEVVLQLKIQIRNLEQIRQNIIELNRAILERSGDLSENSLKFLME